MASINVFFPSFVDRMKADYVFPMEILERCAIRHEEAYFTAYKARLHAHGNDIKNIDPNQSNFILRPLEREDYGKGYLDLMKQLTVVGEVSPDKFNDRFTMMQKPKNAPGTYCICVLEDQANGRIIGSATMLLEWKFIRNCGVRGRVEDVIVDSTYRGKSLAKILCGMLVALAKDANCYKVTLECKDHLIPFYSHFGFAKEPGQNTMCLRIVGGLSKV